MLDDREQLPVSPEVVEGLEAAQRRLVAVNQVVVGVLSSQDSRPRGAANRLANEGILESDALVPYVLPEASYLLGTRLVQVVGEDEDDVGLGGERLRILRHAAREAQREHHNQGHSGQWQNDLPHS